MATDVQFTDLKKIIARRKKGFWAIFMTTLIAGFILAIALPPIYRSEAVIQVEEQEISEEYVQSTISDFVEERIDKITQTILNRDKLLEIAKKYALYSDDKDNISENEVVNKLKKNILLEPIVSDLQGQEQGSRKKSVNIAFILSYQGDNPNKVQRVTETLSNLFLEEDTRRRERVVSVTNEFLKSEQMRIKSEIDAHEKKISEFKKAHLNELPDEQGYNFQAILRLEREIAGAKSKLRLLKEKEMLLNSQLARKVKKEIRELETQVETSDVSIGKVKRLQHLEDQLAEMQGSYGPNHPEIKAVKKEIAILKPQVNSLMTETVKNKISEEKPDNPAYINLVIQSNAIKMEMEAIEADKKQMMEEINQFQRRIEKAPFVEKELNALMLDLESSQSKYRDISDKLMEARVTGELEGSQQADRVSIASSAYLPFEPFKPNRLLILLIGLVNAFVIASLFVAFREGLDNTVKNSDQVKNITNIPMLASISLMITDEDRRLKRRRTFLVILAIILLIGGGVAIVDQFVISVDNLTVKFNQIWSIILERIKMIA
jgi:polysaccharide chain length determinant protein (PEP-CTERM system associated)